MSKLIRGTGDAKRLKGAATPQTVPSIRCTNCGQQAFAARMPDGSTGYKCAACGCVLKTQRF